MTNSILVSYAPATGEEVWRGEHGNVGEAVSRARRAWPAWAALALGNRIEIARRFANEVRHDAEVLAELISRETGKPLWESRTEVDAVVAKVDISVQAYAERTGKKSSIARCKAAPPSGTSRMGSWPCWAPTISPHTCPTDT